MGITINDGIELDHDISYEKLRKLNVSEHQVISEFEIFGGIFEVRLVKVDEV